MLSSWILILSNIAANVLSQDLCPDSQPVLCTCEMVQQVDRGYYKLVNCSDLGLSFVPDNLPLDAQEIDFSVNNLMVTEIDAFKSFPYLTYLSLANNNIDHIPSKGFSNLQYLKELDFTGNLLENISEETFYGLRELEVLKGLETNQILVNAFGVFDKLRMLSITIASEIVPENSFETLLVHTLKIKIMKAKSLPDSIFNFDKNTLTKLTIESKSLLTLPANLLSGLRLLKVFILQTQNLHTLPNNLFHDVDVCTVVMCKPVNLREIETHGVKSLPRDLFQGQESIERITIRGIEDLPAGIFNNLVTLDDLDLSESRLPFISQNLFSSMSSLKTLTLRSCNLMSVTDNIFQGLTSLMNLDVSNNSIQNLANCSFAPFRYSLERLNLSTNNLTDLDRHAFKDMNYLTFLDIADNRLKNLSPDVFYDLIRIRSLSLRNNFMTSLPVLIFRSQRNLREVDLSGNFLEHLPKDLFKGMSSLKRIDLSNNVITTLPDGITAYMFRLDLNMVNNPIHCECKLRSLIVRWIAASKILKIHGHCETPRYLYRAYLQSLTYDETCSDTDHASEIFSTVPSQPIELFPITLMPSTATNIFTVAVFSAGISSLIPAVESPQMKTSIDVLKTSFFEEKETTPVAMILNSKLQILSTSMDEKPYDVDVVQGTHSQILASSTVAALSTDPSQPMEIFLNTLMLSSATNIFSSSDYIAQMTRIYPLMSTAESLPITTTPDVPKVSYSLSNGKEIEIAHITSITNSKLPSSMDDKYFNVYVKKTHTPIFASAAIGSEYPSYAFPVTSLLSSFPVIYPLSRFPEDGNDDSSRKIIKPTPADSRWSKSDDDWSSKLTQETTTSMNVVMTVNATTITTNLSVKETKKATTSISSSNQTNININETMQPEFIISNQSFLSLARIQYKTVPIEETPSLYVAITVVIISFAIGLSIAAVIVWRKRRYRQRTYEVTPVSSKESTINKDSPVTTVSLTRIDDKRN
ncbi:hypothetical protein ACJMK2_016709 [Sinanodonta woodiana]|uniref:Uncharacterized protein n=1 Tax=Sinanodonta woodiana TaxID=1069815 RepID=A0ABD3UUJ9_SINWO